MESRFLCAVGLGVAFLFFFLNHKLDIAVQKPTGLISLLKRRRTED